MFFLIIIIYPLYIVFVFIRYLSFPEQRVHQNRVKQHSSSGNLTQIGGIHHVHDFAHIQKIVGPNGR